MITEETEFTVSDLVIREKEKERKGKRKKERERERKKERSKKERVDGTKKEVKVQASSKRKKGVNYIRVGSIPH